MTLALNDLIRTKISTEGPLSIGAYMDLCLTHPQHGYYMTRDPLGAGGDFTTAPEMTQAFGELLGLWAVEVWRSLGAPAKFSLCEMGPGRGTLMADALRAADSVPGFSDARQLFLSEISPVLKKKQAEKLGAYGPTWISSPAELPDQPVIIIANEFFDALPIRQFQRAGKEWRERCVGLSPQGTLAIVLTPTLDGPAFEMEDGAVVETSPVAVEMASAMARPIVKNRGAGLIIDYGDDEIFSDTLQAVSNHRSAHVLTTSGQADITAHVSFAPLATAVRKIGCRAHGPMEMGVFLKSLGLVERTAQLMAKADEAQQRSLNAAMYRLLDHEAMGALFKVFTFTDKATPTPPGF